MHRLILDRAPFFATALSEPWAESNAKELHLFPQDIDSNITQEAFEKTLHCIYGKTITANTQEKAAGILATACWLELQGLMVCSTTWILRLLKPATLSWPIKLVTANCYGRPGQVILTAAKSMLCRDGWDMPIEYWDDIPGDIVREVVSSDGFFVDGEWSRWLFAKRLLNRRLRQRALLNGLVHPNAREKVKMPNFSHLKFLKSDNRLRTETAAPFTDISEHDLIWLYLYSHPDVEPLLVLLEEGIHYIHLSYEQLQYIRATCDILGMPLVSDKVVINALWTAMELRQIVQNSKGHDTLGLSIPGKTFTSKDGELLASTSSLSFRQDADSIRKGKGKISNTHPASDGSQLDLAFRENGGNKSQRFWIPSVDSNSLVGRDDITSLASQLPPLRPSSINEDPSDMQWTNKYKMHDEPSVSHRNSLNNGNATTSDPENKARPVEYSRFPPYRFAVEFADPRLLQENKRAYSRTVFYAGSFWRIYIQRKRSTKGMQLGVYLHRAKENEVDDTVAIGNHVREVGDGLRTVAETIGMMERGQFRFGQRRSSTFNSSQPYFPGQPDSYATIDTNNPFNASNLAGNAPNSRSDHARSMSSRFGIPSSPSPDNDRHAEFPDSTENEENDKCSCNFYEDDDEDDDDDDNYTIDEEYSHNQNTNPNHSHGSGADYDMDHSDDLESHRMHQYNLPSPYANRRRYIRTDTTAHRSNYFNRPGRRQIHRCNRHHINPEHHRNPQIHTPALPPYIDTRSTIRTYFKIYSPSKGGRALSVYQSAPDKFNFSQSWGWKSNSMLEDDEDKDEDEDEREDEREEGEINGWQGKEDQEGLRHGDGNGNGKRTSAATAGATTLECRDRDRDRSDDTDHMSHAYTSHTTYADTDSARADIKSIGEGGVNNDYDDSVAGSGSGSNRRKSSGLGRQATFASASTCSSKPKPNTTNWKRRKGVLRFMVVIGNV